MDSEQADAGRDDEARLARPKSQALTRTGDIFFPVSVVDEQDWQPHTVDLYSDIYIYVCDGHIYSLGDIRTTATVLVTLLSSYVSSTDEGPRMQQKCALEKF